jgi:adenosine deaminase
MPWYCNLPKIELHIHLEGAIPHPVLFDLIQKYGGDPSLPDVQALTKRFVYRDFPQFIAAWSWKNRFLREYEDFSFIAEHTARDLAGQNIRYAEMFFSPSLFVRNGLEIQGIAREIRKGFSLVPEVEIVLIADLVRDYGPESEMKTLQALSEVRECGIIGIGLGGSEHEYPPEPFAPLFRKAVKMGFRTTAHAGEASGPDSIRGAVRELRVERIGHGTCIRQDPGLLDYVVENRIPLEMCPLSNVRTGAVKTLREHPIRTCFDRGALISVNTDDPALFNTSLAEEYRSLAGECGFSPGEICHIILLGIDSSWLPEEKKHALQKKFEGETSWKTIMI